MSDKRLSEKLIAGLRLLFLLFSLLLLAANGVATGRLLPPVLASATKAKWIREFAEREGINLSESYAYTDSMSDLPMLSIVGHPAAVNPDMRLRQTALHHDWPILNLK